MLAFFCGIAQNVRAYTSDDEYWSRYIGEFIEGDISTIALEYYSLVYPGKITNWGSVSGWNLCLSGKINVEDLKVLWKSSLQGNLSILDMSDVEIEGGEIPDGAFWDEELQQYNSCGLTHSIKLKKIVLPKNTRKIGAKAFANALQLKEVIFPEGLECIGDSAFVNCSLENVELPKSCVDFEGGYQFAHNYFLKKIQLPEGMETLPPGFLSQCILLSEVNIPSTVKHICDYALNECRSVRYLDLPPCLETIGERAFFCMDILFQLNFPATMKSIGRASCLYLSNLRYIYCAATVPPECEIVDKYYLVPFGVSGSNILGITPEYLGVYVPKGCAEAYRKAFGWDYFKFIIETDEFPDASVHDVVVYDNADNDMIFDLEGRVVKNPQAGHLYIKNRKKFIYSDM